MSETNIPNPNPTFPINNKPIGTRPNQPLVAFTVVPLSSHTRFMAYIFSRAAQNTWKGVLLPRDYCSCTVVGTSCSATSIAMLRARRTALLTLQFVHTQTLRPLGPAAWSGRCCDRDIRTCFRLFPPSGTSGYILYEKSLDLGTWINWI